MTKEFLFKLSDYSSATWSQSKSLICIQLYHVPKKKLKLKCFVLDFVASIAGAVASITVAAPLDVVKTRIQNANFGSSVGGATIIKDMIKQEGVGAFFKGLTPKVSLDFFY